MPRFDAPHSRRIQTIRLSSLDHAWYRQANGPQALRGPAAVDQKSMAHISPSIVLKRSLLMTLAVLMTVFYPAAGIYAEEVALPPEAPPVTETASVPVEETPPPPVETPPPPAPEPVVAAPAPTDVQGPTQPPGPERTSYTYNPETGLYENDKYTWDPVTKQTKPKTPQTYSYNPETNRWDTTEQRYDPTVGHYVPNTVSVQTLPPGASALSLAPTGPEGGSNYVFDLFYDASISNKVNSFALSGDALVGHNTTGGSALTGDALAMANIFNLLQSSASFLGGGQITTFNSDVNGDVFGDLYVDPRLLAQVQPAGMTDNTNVKLNIDENGQITNNVVLDAASGNATVEGNTTAGDATTGSADAVANIVNMLNSAINTGSSFIGMLNIYGNLNGDILLPPGLLNTLLASNATAPPTTSLNSDNIENSELLAQFNTNQAINNNIDAAATSGNATVSHNTSAGNATTGDASTNVTVLNLTGRQIVGSNSLLVFVNVLGKWVGVIVDAPTGSTSAALGSGITQNSCDACGAGDTEINADTDSRINNNVSVRAASGDATVANNTTAGNATSGNATASVNLLNIMNSSMSFSDWFGILFINVFGTWNGSFGMDTEAGEEDQPAPVAETAASTGGSGGGGQTGANVRAFRFIPTGNGTQRLSQVELGEGEAENAVAQAATAVLASSDAPAVENLGGETQAKGTNWTLPAVGLLAGCCLLGIERYLAFRQRRTAP